MDRFEACKKTKTRSAMKKPMLYIAVLLLAGLTGCVRDIDLDYPAGPSRQALNSIFTSGDSVFLNISRSRGINEPQNFSGIQDPVLRIFENNQQAGYFINSGLDSLGVPGSTYTALNMDGTAFIPQRGKTYTVTSIATGFDSVWAEVKVPDSVSFYVTSVDSGKTDAKLGDYVELYFVLDDKVSTEDYYILNALVVDSGAYQDEFGNWFPFVEEYNACMQLLDTRLNTSIGGPFSGIDDCSNEYSFDDRLFNGQSVSSSVRVFISNEEFLELYNRKIYLELALLNNDLYQYTRTRRQAENAQGNPFAEPVQVYTNVRNGFGIIGGRTVVRSLIQLQ